MSHNQPSSCIFCQIAAKAIPSSCVYEDDHTFAFLDTSPIFHGHVLVVPKIHVDVLPELEAHLILPLFDVVKKISTAIEQGLEAHGTFVAINNRVSQSVPHLHVHIIPRHKKDGLRGFFWPHKSYSSDEQREDFRLKIANSLSAEKL